MCHKLLVTPYIYNMDIKKAIKAHGQTISSIADKLGITQSALSQQINNNTITLAKVEQIAAICGVPFEDFISRHGEDRVSKLYCPHCGKPIELEIKLKEGK